MPQPMERAYVSMPTDLNAALRERLQETDGPAAAELPLAMLLRYVAARVAGIPAANATRYGRGLPRGINSTDQHFPKVKELIR